MYVRLHTRTGSRCTHCVRSLATGLLAPSSVYDFSDVRAAYILEWLNLFHVDAEFCHTEDGVSMIVQNAG